MRWLPTIILRFCENSSCGKLGTYQNGIHSSLIFRDYIHEPFLTRYIYEYAVITHPQTFAKPHYINTSYYLYTEWRSKCWIVSIAWRSGLKLKTCRRAKCFLLCFTLLPLCHVWIWPLAGSQEPLQVYKLDSSDDDHRQESNVWKNESEKEEDAEVQGYPLKWGMRQHDGRT